MTLGLEVLGIAMLDKLAISLLLAEGDAPVAQPFQIPVPILLAIILLTGYLLVFRPQQRKQADVKAQLENLKEKDRVVTIGGIHGRVTNVQRDSDLITIQIDEATGAKMRINRSAVSRLVTDDVGSQSEKKK